MTPDKPDGKTPRRRPRRGALPTPGKIIEDAPLFVPDDAVDPASPQRPPPSRPEAEDA